MAETSILPGKAVQVPTHNTLSGKIPNETHANDIPEQTIYLPGQKIYPKENTQYLTRSFR
jgi:hypothetical protein